MKFKLKNRQDIQAESITGVRFEFDDRVWFQSLRAGGSNGKYTAALQVMNQEIIRKYGSRPVPREVHRQMQAKLYAETCLLNWGKGETSGLPSEDGPVPFTPAAALQFLTDPEYDVYWLEYDNRVSDPRNFMVEGADGGGGIEQIGTDLGN